MAHNLFDNAKFADIFVTTENKQAVFLRLSENAENKFAVLYVKDWGTVQVFRHNGNEVNGDIAHSIIRKQEEPISEDSEEIVKGLWNEINSGHEYSIVPSYNVFYGLCLDIANWQKEQCEKGRLKHCDELTKEQAQIESDFVVNHLKKHNRTPTFIDAIEYGKSIVLAELEKIVKEKEEAGKNYVFAFSEVKELVKKMSKKE